MWRIMRKKLGICGNGRGFFLTTELHGVIYSVAQRF